MTGRGKIEALTNEWYGFVVFAALVNIGIAIWGSLLFSFVSVPFVIGVSVINLVITWAIGRLLMKRSSLTRIILLILSPIAMLLGAAEVYQFLVSSWSISLILTNVIVACGVWMNLRSFLVLIDKDVRAYFR
jgi:hypothetical protein